MTHAQVPHKPIASTSACARKRRVLSQGRVSIEASVAMPRHHSLRGFSGKDGMGTPESRKDWRPSGQSEKRAARHRRILPQAPQPLAARALLLTALTHCNNDVPRVSPKRLAVAVAKQELVLAALDLARENRIHAFELHFDAG